MRKLNPQLIKLIKKVNSKLIDKKYKISTAESCTGGLLSAYFTSISGSSLYFDCGIISYSNDSKTKLLNVPAEILSKYGAVSEETAKHMAKGVYDILKSDVCIAITGIAGTGGGSAEKPVGTVCFGFHTDKTLQTFIQFFDGNRNEIRYQSCIWALNKIDELLNEN